MSNTTDTLNAIKMVLSPGRIGRYEAVLGVTAPDDTRAVALYAWNAQVSAFFFTPLHICEVAVRNAASEALETLYGPRWPWVTTFVRSVLFVPPGSGYNPRGDLERVARQQLTTGKVIPELKFAFWETLFTARHDSRIWSSELVKVFPHHDPTATWFQLRSRIYGDLQIIRKLRNRIAHHEPVFMRNLADDFQRVHDLVALRSLDVASWLLSNQNASRLIPRSPEFRGGQNWNPSQGEIAQRAYEKWQRRVDGSGSADEDWFQALQEMLG